MKYGGSGSEEGVRSAPHVSSALWVNMVGNAAPTQPPQRMVGNAATVVPSLIPHTRLLEGMAIGRGGSCCTRLRRDDGLCDTVLGVIEYVRYYSLGESSPHACLTEKTSKANKT